MNNDCHIRWTIRRDVPEVMDIERRCFEHPWTENDLIRALRQRNCISMVAERDERVVGYIVYELHKSRLHILNLAVHPEDWRTGVGSALLRKMETKLSQQRRNRLSLEVRETNLDALLFFKSQGFKAIGVLRDFYEDKYTTEDAVLMHYQIGANVRVAK